jgi:hypothetical protein
VAKEPATKTLKHQIPRKKKFNSALSSLAQKGNIFKLRFGGNLVSWRFGGKRTRHSSPKAPNPTKNKKFNSAIFSLPKGNILS